MEHTVWAHHMEQKFLWVQGMLILILNDGFLGFDTTFYLAYGENLIILFYCLSSICLKLAAIVNIVLTFYISSLSMIMICLELAAIVNIVLKFYKSRCHKMLFFSGCIGD